MNDLGDFVGVELNDLESKLLNVHVVLMAIAAWFLLWAIRKMWKGMDGIEWVRRFKPLYPVLLCEAFVWIPGIIPDATIGERVLMAVWAGVLAAIGYQIIRRVVKKVGVELPADATKLTPTDPPTEAPPEENKSDDTIPDTKTEEEKPSEDEDKTPS